MIDSANVVLTLHQYSHLLPADFYYQVITKAVTLLTDPLANKLLSKFDPGAAIRSSNLSWFVRIRIAN